MSKYDAMLEYYKMQRDIDKNEAEFWRKRYVEVMNKAAKVDIYEKLLNKFMEGHPEKTDEFIMFEGKIYKLRSAVLDMEPSERADILTLECVKVDFPK